MNLRRGLFRLWLCLTAIWLVPTGLNVWLVYSRTGGADAFSLGFALLPPLVLLAIGSGLCWAVDGFGG